MPDMPTGTVTFLFTDLESSTRMWEAHTAAMEAALERHDAILRNAIGVQRGFVFSTAGDALAAAFGSHSAVAAALAAQEQLGAENWPEPVVLRARMGLHTGEAQERDGDYFGPTLNRAARLMSAGHGGQILVSSVTAELLNRDDLRELGTHRLKDLSGTERIWQVGSGDFPALRTLDASPGNLPLQTTSFVGREAHVAEVVEAVRAHRLVTLTGVGGVGKTRLALHVAAELVSEYEGGAWVVELAPVGESEEGLGEDEAELHLALGNAQNRGMVIRDGWRNTMIAMSKFRERGDRTGLARTAIQAANFPSDPERRQSVLGEGLKAVSGTEPYLEAQLLTQLVRTGSELRSVVRPVEISEKVDPGVGRHQPEVGSLADRNYAGTWESGRQVVDIFYTVAGWLPPFPGGAERERQCWGGEAGCPPLQGVRVDAEGRRFSLKISCFVQLRTAWLRPCLLSDLQTSFLPSWVSNLKSALLAARPKCPSVRISRAMVGADADRVSWRPPAVCSCSVARARPNGDGATERGTKYELA